MQRILSWFVLGVFLVLPTVVQAANLNDLYDEKKRIEKEITSLKDKAGKTEQKIDTLESAVAYLNRSIDTISGEITGTEQGIAETLAAIEEKEKELAAWKRLQDEGVRVLYELQATDSVVESLLGNENLSDATNRVEYLDALEQRVRDVMAAIQQIKNDLDGKKTELENLRAQQADQKTRLESRQAQKSRLLTNSNVELGKINRQLDADQIKIANIEAQIAAQVAALWRRRGISSGTGTRVGVGTPIGRLGSTGYSTGPHLHFECLKSGTPVNPRGCVPPLVWPIADFSVSQEFGKPNWNAAYDWHTGIDLVNDYGTLVRAACSGEIILSQWYGGYGNAVVIDCGNGLWTLYGHMIN